MRNKETILFLGAVGVGDRVASIPYLVEKKKEGKRIILLDYEYKYYGNTKKRNYTLEFLKENNLYDDLFTIPYNKLKLIIFILKNLFKYKESYAPTKTLVVSIRGKLFSRKFSYTFKNLNDNRKYDNFVSGMLDKKIINYSAYKNELKYIPYNSEYHNKFGISNNFVTIYVGPYGGSIEHGERINLFDYLRIKGFQIILVGGSEEFREQWIIKYIKNQNNIINLLGKTSFEELCSILQDAKFTISANGGIMWLSHFLNEKSISFSISSGFIIHPPVDNKTSFHIHANACPFPCEIRKPEDYYKNNGYKYCIFKNSDKEGYCKKIINANILRTYINTFTN